MKGMKKIFGMGSLVLAASLTSAQAGIPIPFDPDGAGPLVATSSLANLEWTVGNALSVFDGPPIAAGGTLPAVGTTLTTYYQAKLAGFTTTAGFENTFANPGATVFGSTSHNIPFSENFEWTAVAKFKEVVVSASGGQTIVAVIPDPDNYFRIFYDGPSNGVNGGGAGSFANDLAGTGFADGVMILEARGGQGLGIFQGTGGPSVDLDQFAGSSPEWGGVVTPYQTIQGIGTFQADATITMFDSAFFTFPPLLGQQILLAMHDTDQQLPFDGVNPSVQFWDDVAFINGQFGVGATEYLLMATNGIGDGVGNAIQFEADADTSFDIAINIPEPATAMLALFGLTGLALRGRRNREA